MACFTSQQRWLTSVSPTWATCRRRRDPCAAGRRSPEGEDDPAAFASHPVMVRWLWLLERFSYVAALFSKTVTCSLPAALLLVRWWKKGRLKLNDILPLVPFFVGEWLGVVYVLVGKKSCWCAGPGMGVYFLGSVSDCRASLMVLRGQTCLASQTRVHLPALANYRRFGGSGCFPVAAVFVVA